jgi:protein-L-isoaspartate(D-aspartate) O-methyltransferase
MEMVMNVEQARFNMVEQQIRPWVLVDESLAEQIAQVKREDFVPAQFVSLAFADTEIPLGEGAAMLSPKMEAQALQALKIKRHDRVLEIGTGSGHMAALLSVNAEQVWSVEIDPTLAATARANFKKVGIDNVTVIEADGLTGLPASQPYDAIAISGGVSAVSPALLDQLKIGGRLFAIVGSTHVMEGVVITRVSETAYTTVSLFETQADYLKGAAPASSFAL